MSSDPRPPATATRHPLPFGSLSPADFERLCLWLVRREGYEKAEHFGDRGRDQGRDVVAFRDGRRLVFQCKRVARLEPGDAEREIAKLLRLPEATRPEEVIFVVSTTVEAATRDRAKAAWPDPNRCGFWSGTELDERVKRHPDILEEFFDLGGAEPVPKPPRFAEALLEIWLDRVARGHRELMPYFERRGAPLLEHVYVELQLSPRRHRGSTDPTGRQIEELRRERLLGRPMSIREVLDLDPRNDPWVTRRWLLRGDPGSGKTTLLRHLAWTLAVGGGKPWVPVFESLPRLLREPRSLLEGIELDLKRADLPGQEIRRTLEDAAGNGGLLFLLDGLDEVPRDLHHRAETFLVDLAARWPRSPFVVATRSIGAWAPGPEYRELEVLPFDSERRRAFLAQWFGHEGVADTERADEVAGVLEADRNLRELASNPLYVTLLALLVEKGISVDRKRAGLYDRVFELLLQGEHREPPMPMERPAAVRRMLRHLGYSMTEDNRDSEPLAAVEDRLYQDEAAKLREDLERVARWRPGLSVFLADLAERSGILGPHDGPEADWRFWHRTFREGLTAEQLAEAYASGGRVAIVEHARQIAQEDLSRWAEPYALLAGLIQAPDDLVKVLVKANPALGLRALATSQGLEDETLGEILELSGDPKERAKVYERVPELIDDPIRALALLDKLRRRTRDGSDLFHLEQAAVAAGEKWPEARSAAVKLQTHLYDHIPPPREELFRWIETPHDGRVGLWREIPAGKFLMGSLAEEEDSYDDERPRHPVVIQSPFWMAAVPVTVAQYQAFDPEYRPSRQGNVPDEELATHPADNVTWYQAFAFCRWLSAAVPWIKGARLPTEEEWEYACRAGTQTRYWSGDQEADLDRVGWYTKNSGGRTHRVGEKPANPWGLYDVHGNTWEWTRSEWTGDYSGREGGIEVDPAAVDPADLAAPRGAGRVVRGGWCWDEARGMRSAYRNVDVPRDVFWVEGFRVCLSAAPE